MTAFSVVQELLTAALTHFQAFSQADFAARACLALAQLEKLANQPQAALGLVQQAQHFGGGTVATCCKAVRLYAELCCQLKRQPEAVAALQSGIELMGTLVRSAS